MNEIQVISAKLKGAIFCHYGLRVDIGKDRHDVIPTIKSERPIHDDLRDAFSALTVHLPVIFGDILPGDIEDINSDVNDFRGSSVTRAILAKFHILEVNLDPEKQCVQLVGSKVLTFEKMDAAGKPELITLGTAPITTPEIYFAGPYHYALELQYGVDMLFKEVAEYRDGKQAPEVIQTEMFDSGEGNDPDEVIKPAKVKKPGRKKKKKVVGNYNDPGFPDYAGLDIVSEDTADAGDIIGIDELSGAPILKMESEPLTNFQVDPKDVKD